MAHRSRGRGPIVDHGRSSSRGIVHRGSDRRRRPRGSCPPQGRWILPRDAPASRPRRSRCGRSRCAPRRAGRRLDPAGRREVLDLITAIRGKATVLFSSHILDDVQEVCDRVGILRRGELVHQGTLDDLLRSRAVASYTVVVRSDADRDRRCIAGRSLGDERHGRKRLDDPSRGQLHAAAEVGLVPLLAARGPTHRVARTQL